MDQNKDIDRMSEASFGSVISLHSIGSDGVSHSPRPPSGQKKRKPIEGKRSKVQRASPYAQPVSPKVPLKQPKRITGRELWVTALRQGKGYSNESTAMDTWNGFRPSHARASPGLHSASNYLIEQLLQSTDPSLKKHARSASTGLARVGGNGPKYKQAEEYYDEVLELKKTINGLKADNDTLKLKLVKVENDNNLKAKRIEELLNPNKQTNEMRRTLTDKKPQSSKVVYSLKQQHSALERSLKSREDELRKLRNELKSTSIEEARIQADVYYQEVQRLKQMQAESSLKSSSQLTRDINAEKTPEGKLKKMHEAVKVLSEDKQRLVQENMSLKQDLAKSLEAHVNGVNLSKEVEDMSRSELLAKIGDLEQKLKLEEKKEDETEGDSSTDKGQIKLQGSVSQQLKQLREREKELLKENETLKEKVKRLKEDRAHYRKIADGLRHEIDAPRAPVDDTASISTISHPTEQETRERSSSHRSAKAEKELRKKKSLSNDDKTRLNQIQANEAARKIQRNWRRHQHGASEIMGLDNKDDDDDEFEQSILTMQAAFRGHMARDSYFKSRREVEVIEEEKPKQESLSDTEDVILIQSAFRGHLSRQRLLGKTARAHELNERNRPSIREYGGDEEQEVRSSPRTFRSRTTGSLVSIQDTADQDDRDSSVYGDEQEYLKLARIRYGGKRESKSSYDAPTSSRASKKTSAVFREDDEGLRYRPLKDDLKDSSASRQKFRGSIRKGQDYEDVSVNNLKASSSPWSKDKRGSKNRADEVDSDDDDDVMIMPSRKRTESSSTDRKTSSQASTQLAQIWAQSGKSSVKDTSKLAPPPSRGGAFGNDDDDDDDDDDDIVISPAITRRQTKKVEPKEELF